MITTQQDAHQNNHTCTFMYIYVYDIYIIFVYVQKLVYEIFLKDHKKYFGKNSCFARTRQSIFREAITLRTCSNYNYHAFFIDASLSLFLLFTYTGYLDIIISYNNY